MNTIKINAEKYKASIMESLGMTQEEYLLHQMSMMQKYVGKYCGYDPLLMTQLLNSIAFENWWKNSWNKRNFEIFHQYCLSSYRNRERQNKPTRISRWRLTMVYYQLHQVDPHKVFPSSAVWELINTEKS